MKNNLIFVLSITAHLGLAVAIPTLTLAYTGHWLDERFQKNYFIIIGLAVAFFISMSLVYFIAKSFTKNVSKK